MKITKDMVDEINQFLKSEECIFRIKFYQPEPQYNPDCKIVAANEKFLDGYNIYATSEFRNYLDNFFKERGIILCYNNSKTAFWSKNGFKDAQ